MLRVVILKAINSQKTRALEVSVNRVEGLESTKTEEFAERLTRVCAQCFTEAVSLATGCSDGW